MFLLRLKVSSPDLHRFPLVSLLLVRVQSPRQVPTPSKSHCFSAKMFNEHLWLTTRRRQGSKRSIKRRPARPYHVSLFFSFASLSYFSRVRLSTIPVRYLTGGNARKGHISQTGETQSVALRLHSSFVFLSTGTRRHFPANNKLLIGVFHHVAFKRTLS